MSYFNTKQALLEQLTMIVSESDLALENNNFDPSNKDVWYAAFFIPATTDSLGKDSAARDEQRGIFQVSVSVKRNGGVLDNTQLQAIDSILTAFRYNTELVYNTQKVWINDSTVNNGFEVDSWFRRDISINYSTYSERV